MTTAHNHLQSSALTSAPAVLEDHASKSWKAMVRAGSQMLGEAIERYKANGGRA